MIEKLHFRRLSAQVFHDVVNHQAIGPGDGSECCCQAETTQEQTGLFHFALDAQLKRRIEADAHLDIMGRRVGDPAMQSQASAGHWVLAGRPVPAQTAAAQPLVKPAQPADPAVFLLIDKPRMNGTENGRSPAEGIAAVLAPPQAHASGRQHREG